MDRAIEVTREVRVGNRVTQRRAAIEKALLLPGAVREVVARVINRRISIGPRERKRYHLQQALGMGPLRHRTRPSRRMDLTR